MGAGVAGIGLHGGSVAGLIIGVVITLPFMVAFFFTPPFFLRDWWGLFLNSLKKDTSNEPEP
jgi:hypothetical protein